MSDNTIPLICSTPRAPNWILSLTSYLPPRTIKYNDMLNVGGKLVKLNWWIVFPVLVWYFGEGRWWTLIQPLVRFDLWSFLTTEGHVYTRIVGMSSFGPLIPGEYSNACLSVVTCFRTPAIWKLLLQLSDLIVAQDPHQKPSCTHSNLKCTQKDI